LGWRSWFQPIDAIRHRRNRLRTAESVNLGDAEFVAGREHLAVVCPRVLRRHTDDDLLANFALARELPLDGCSVSPFIPGDETPLAGFDDTSYVRMGAFERRPFSDVLDEWAAARKATLLMVRGMPSEAWARRGTASNYEVTVLALAYIIAGHELHHRRLFQQNYFPASVS